MAVLLASRADEMLRLGRVMEAYECCKQAILAFPQSAEAFNSLGLVLVAAGRNQRAIQAYRAAIKNDPRHAATHFNLGNLLRDMGMWKEAMMAFRAAISINPGYAAAHNSLGVMLKDLGRLDEAMACYDAAMEHGNVLAQHNKLYGMHFHPSMDARTIAEAHRRWDTAEQAPVLPHQNRRDPRRKLRVGYVGANFRDHRQTYFTLPLFRHHDRTQVELYCYSDVKNEDQFTESLRRLDGVWRDTAVLDDAALARRIRADGIDVLVDLTMHMSGSRLRMFALKPAPVQVTWLAYPSTTGLRAMDYRLSDPYLDPPNDPSRPALYTEQTVRLPSTFWCFAPLEDRPPRVADNPDPMLTFCCLNAFSKINVQTLKLWARVMRAVPRSRLVLLAPPLAHDGVRKVMGAEGIDAGRLLLTERMARSTYLQVWSQADVALDTMPYTGHATTLDALWMGVPVVTRYGDTAVSRGAMSMLRNVGLTDLAASTDDAFVEIASRLAGDAARRRRLHAELRQRMASSPLMDARKFARDVETAYRAMWESWCGATAAVNQRSATT